jgi:hypothetical protein
MIRPSITAHPVWKFFVISETHWKDSILGVIGKQCQSLAELNTRAYLLFAATFALVCYAYLLLFPWLVFRSGVGLHEVLFRSQTLVWSHLLIWLAKTVSAKAQREDAMPSLAKRAENIGYTLA